MGFDGRLLLLFLNILPGRFKYMCSNPDYKQDFQEPKMMKNSLCKFCYSNGEAESQYRSHELKNSSGLVTCPICKATGDFAHTQRYCPRNKDGQFNSGASLT